MTTITTKVRDPGRGYMMDFIQPGPQGPVGDVLMRPRFAQSNPDMRMRYDPAFTDKKQLRLGSNVSDGQHKSFDSGGGPARLIDADWWGERDERTATGWVHQDIRATDRTAMPVAGEMPNFSWNNKIATLYKERHVGDMFLPLPYGYAPGPGHLPVGGNGPVITNVIQPMGYPIMEAPEQGKQYYEPPENYDPQIQQATTQKRIDQRQVYLLGRGPQRSGTSRNRF